MLLDCIIQSDNVETLKGMKQESIDLVVTSPPYDELRLYGGHGWDFYGVAWLLRYVLKPGGVIVWVVNDSTKNGSETGTSMRQALHFQELGLNLHDTMIYQTNKPPLTHNRYDPAWEYMFVLSKGKPKTWNPQKEPSKYAGQKRCATMRQDSDQLSNRSAKGVVQEEKLLTNVWYLPRASHTDGKERAAHPATFPLELAKRHIATWSNPGDVVLDPFCGSGTTCIAAKELCRRWIGIEVSSEYVQIAQSRIDMREKG